MYINDYNSLQGEIDLILNWEFFKKDLNEFDKYYDYYGNKHNDYWTYERFFWVH